MVHDPLLILGIFSMFHIPFDLKALAALLAVIGYSLNDTIVVFDRIREVKGKSPNLTEEIRPPPPRWWCCCRNNSVAWGCSEEQLVVVGVEAAILLLISSRTLWGSMITLLDVL